MVKMVRKKYCITVEWPQVQSSDWWCYRCGWVCACASLHVAQLVSRPARVPPSLCPAQLVSLQIHLQCTLNYNCIWPGLLFLWTFFVIALVIEIRVIILFWRVTEHSFMSIYLFIFPQWWCNGIVQFPCRSEGLYADCGSGLLHFVFIVFIVGKYLMSEC